jgi:quercetin dioxygenase-like cupin family protein
MTTLPAQKAFASADFDKTPPEPHVIIPEKLIHEGVESAGKQDDFSKERKHPVFFVDLPSKCLSLTIGWLDPEQSSNMHRHTYETILYVLEGEGYSQVQGENAPLLQNIGGIALRQEIGKHITIKTNA